MKVAEKITIRIRPPGEEGVWLGGAHRWEVEVASVELISSSILREGATEEEARREVGRLIWDRLEEASQ